MVTIRRGCFLKYYLFPKFFVNCITEELMAYTAELGFDGPTALVRDGYALTPENLREACRLIWPRRAGRGSR